MSNTGLIQVDFNGMRSCIWGSMSDVIDSAESLLNEYNETEDSSYVNIEKDVLLSLFENINALREGVGDLMCIKSELLGFDNLVHLLEDNYLDINGDEEDNE